MGGCLALFRGMGRIGMSSWKTVPMVPSGIRRTRSAPPRMANLTRQTPVELSISASSDLPRMEAAMIRRTLRRLVPRLLQQIGSCRGVLHFHVVGDPEMKDLHSRFCNNSATTDVLTFDFSPTTRQARSQNLTIDAEIVLCADEARRQASARKTTISREILLYALHGILHCMGHDDCTKEAYRAMHSREDELLRTIGVGPLFYPNSPSSRQAVRARRMRKQ